MTRTSLLTYALSLGFVVTAVTVYIGQSDPKTGIPDPVLGISFSYTDDNSGECLTIYTNNDTYTNGLSHAEVYAAVVNNCGATQDIELLAYFEDTKKRVDNVSVLTTMTRAQTVPQVETQCREETSTSTKETVEVCEDVVVRTDVESYTVQEWLPLPLLERSTIELTKEVAYLTKENITRKAEATYTASRKSQGFTLNPGEVVYYKVIIKFPPNESGAFFFEAIGSEGGYGHLQ